jgi:ABC-type multidrug transport system ATPase subunit
LLHKPQYLILDEAFSALDYEVVNNFLGLLRKRKPEIHLILTSHILPYLDVIMDKVMILEEGELTFYGPKSELDTSKLPFLSTSTDFKVIH